MNLLRCLIIISSSVLIGIKSSCSDLHQNIPIISETKKNEPDEIPLDDHEDSQGTGGKNFPGDNDQDMDDELSSSEEVQNINDIYLLYEAYDEKKALLDRLKKALDEREALLERVEKALDRREDLLDKREDLLDKREYLIFRRENPLDGSEDSQDRKEYSLDRSEDSVDEREEKYLVHQWFPDRSGIPVTILLMVLVLSQFVRY